MYSKLAQPVLSGAGVWAAANPEAYKKSAEALPYINPEDEFIARQLREAAAKAAAALPKATP